MKTIGMRNKIFDLGRFFLAWIDYVIKINHVEKPCLIILIDIMLKGGQISTFYNQPNLVA